MILFVTSGSDSDHDEVDICVHSSWNTSQQPPPNIPVSNSTPVKLLQNPSISSPGQSFVNIEFKATSTPIAPKRRCRTRGGHSSFNLNKFHLPPQPRQLLPQPQPLLPQPQPQLQLFSSSSSNKRPLCTPSKQPKPCSSSNNWEIDFSSDVINDSILLQDIVDTAPSTISPSNSTRQLKVKNKNKDLKFNNLKFNNLKFNNLSNKENNNNNNNSPTQGISMNSSPDIPSSTPYIPHIPLSDDIDDFTWSDDNRDYREFLFAGPSGVKINLDDTTCPLSILKTFLTDELISNIVLFTNTYAEICKMHPLFTEKVGGFNRTLLDLWKEVTKDDIWIYICLTILMGIINKPHYHMYWSTDPILCTPIFSRLMRRDRFEQIRSMVHFTDPLNEKPEDPLRKLSSFLEYLQSKFVTNYIPTQHVAVDEYLSAWKGRLGFHQYIPSKRERYGIKIYMLCESDSAYLWKFLVYTGVATIYPVPSITLPKPFHEYKNPSKVVLSLLDGLYNQGYNVTLDNLYTSPELLRVLFMHHIDAYGTLRKKAGLPTDFWQWKPVQEVGAQPIIKFCEELMVSRWSDSYKVNSKKVVSMLSTKHTGLLKETGKIDFRSKKLVLKPDVIVEYNATMGGVDTLSRVLNPYLIQHKGLKWYRKVAELFIDISIYNSFVLWKQLNNVDETHLGFRQKLIEEIITYHSFGQ